MILIDTCGWIEWLTAGPLCLQFEPYFNRIESVIVPTSVCKPGSGVFRLRWKSLP